MKVRTKHLTLLPKQKQFHTNAARFRAYIGGRGSGKTYGLAADLLLRAKPSCNYLVLGPTQQILREGMISAINTIGTDLGIVRRAGGNPYRIDLINDARITCRTAKLPDNLRGGSYSGAVLDEAALLAPAVRDIVQATLREHGSKGWMSFGSTPKGRAHWLYQEIATGRQNTFMVRSHSLNNTFVDAEQVQSLIDLYDEHFRRQEIEGEFLDADEELQVLPTSWVEAAMRRGEELARSSAPLPRLEALGVDTARGGDSRFTLAFRHANIISALKAYPGSRASTSQLGASLIVAALGDNREPHVWIDISGGTGSGVFDLLNDSTGYKVHAVNFGAGTRTLDRTGKYRFANQRAFMYWTLREALDPCGGVNLSLPNSYELAAELTAVHWHMNGGGAIVLQPKEQIKEVLRRSPDLADAVALTMLN